MLTEEGLGPGSLPLHRGRGGGSVPGGQRWATDRSAKGVWGCGALTGAGGDVLLSFRDGNGCGKGGLQPERKTCRKEEACRRKFSIFRGICMQKTLNTFSNYQLGFLKLLGCNKWRLCRSPEADTQVPRRGERRCRKMGDGSVGLAEGTCVVSRLDVGRSTGRKPGISFLQNCG